MEMAGIAFGTTDWSGIPPTEHKGETGIAYWRTRDFGNIRVRMVDYTPGYKADHWCVKGHILLCIEGRLHRGIDGSPRCGVAPAAACRQQGGQHRGNGEGGAVP